MIDAIEAMKACIYESPKMRAKLFIEKDHIYCHNSVQTVYKRIRGIERNIIQKKREYLKLFFNFILSEADLNTCEIKPLEENQPNVRLKIEASVAKQE